MKTETTEKTGFLGKIDKFFKISERGSTIGRELMGGLVIFLAMIYILPVNAGILSITGMGYAAVFVATALAAGIATILMGLIANYTIGLAAGMGLNALMAFTVCGGLGFSWQECLACVFISGILFLIISLTGVRKKIINAIPKNLKLAIGAGIGGFVAFIGLKNAGIIIADPAGTFVTLNGSPAPVVYLGLFGIVLAFCLYAMKNKASRFAVIISMAVTALIGLFIFYVFKLGGFNADIMNSFPHFGTNESISDIKNIFGGCFSGFKTVFAKPEAYAVIFTFLFVDFFDTAGTLVAVGQDAGLVDEKGELVDGNKAMIADAVGTVAGAVLGTSTVTSFVESSTGVKSGARTGLAACVTGVLFFLSIVLFPVFSIFTNSATTSMALVLVGAMMFASLKNIEWDDKITVASAFITILSMLLCYSISEGIAFGFIFYVAMMLFAKRHKEVNWIMYVLAGLFVLNFVVKFAFL